MSATGLSYHAYDFLTGLYLMEVPVRGVTFTETLDSVGTFKGSVDLNDPAIQPRAVLQATIPNRSVLVADWKGVPLWAGVSLPRKWDVDSSGSSTTGVLELSYSGLWAYFQQRIQATDYSSPPFSGITGESPMELWPQAPWFAPLIACQVVKDALTVPYGNPLGGMSVTLNGEAPTAQFGHEVSESDYVAVSYPYPSLASVESIVTGLADLGLGVGFDFAIQAVYSQGQPYGDLKARFEVDWPWRGAPEDTDDRSPLWLVDLVRARKYSFPEDGSQTGNQVYETGGGGAIYVDGNLGPLEQGYPLVEKVVSRSGIQSPDIMGLLALNGDSDLSIYSYAPTTPTVTLGIEDPEVLLGPFRCGDLMRLTLPAKEGAPGWDPRFPDGLDQVWRLTSYTVDAKDEGDATMTLSFAPPVLYLAEVNLPALP